MTAWTTIRTLAAQAAEAAPTTTIDIDVATPRVEFRVQGGSIAGAPTSVTFAVWRGFGGRIDKLGTFTVALADIATVVPQLFELNAHACAITVESFAGGATPTVTATIEARGVYGA